MKRTIFNLAICAFFTFTYPAFATRYHVNINKGDDANDGLLWSTAFKNLQTAIDASEEGDEIWIAAGVYHPTKKIADVYGSGDIVTTPTNDRHRSFLINKNIALYGGFPASPSDAAGMNERDWRRNQTVLSGDFDDNDGDNFENMDENAYHVVILFDAAPSLVLDGFFITGGCADDDNTVYVDGSRAFYVTGGYGGGIYAYAVMTVSSPTLSNLSFYGNYALQSGGAIYNFAFANDASPSLTNMFIVHNKAKNKHGGGLFNDGGGQVHAELVNINVVGNESALSGGGLYFHSIEECSPSIINTVVNGNYASNGNGGGVFMSTSYGPAEPTIINTTICGNRITQKDGGGLVIWPIGISKANIYNTVIWGNKGNGIDNFYAEGELGGAANTIKGSFIEGYDDADPTNLPGNTDPMFLEPVHGDFAPTMDGDYQLTTGSPLINKGLNTVVTLPFDLLGNTRIFGSAVDIGAYESQGKAPQFNETVASEKTIWSNSGYLYVRINQTTTLHVYALDGTLVKHVSNLGEGMYEFALPRGFYIVTLSNGLTEKIVIR